MNISHDEEAVKSEVDNDDNRREEYAEYLAVERNDERDAMKECVKNFKEMYLYDGKNNEDDWAA